MKESPATIPKAIEIYQAILEIRAKHEDALINLGTILYNQRHYEQAEQHYRLAILC